MAVVITVAVTVTVGVAVNVTKWPLDAQVISSRIICAECVVQVGTSQHVLEVPLS